MCDPVSGELTVKFLYVRRGRKATRQKRDSVENIEGSRKWLLIAVQLQLLFALSICRL